MKVADLFDEDDPSEPCERCGWEMSECICLDDDDWDDDLDFEDLVDLEEEDE